MYYAYVLKSLRSITYYTGHTSDLEKRLDQHNKGKSLYTRRYGPWIVVYSEEFATEIESIKREKYFKSSAGRKWLKKNVNK